MTRITLGGAVLRGTISTALMASLMSASALGAPPVDLSKWSPEYVRSIAGTQDFDTAADCAKVTPLDYKGRLTFWYQGVFEGDPDLLRQYYKDFFETFRKTYPNIQLEEQALTYNDLLDKFRTALLGNAAPMVVRLQILGGVEFAAKGYLQPLKPEDVGYSTEDFWPGAMKSVTWEGKTYGIPTNNETMAFIWNADIFKRAGLDPDKAPATWDDVVKYSKQIHDKLGIAGYGLVAKQERRQHAVPLHAAALGLWRRRARRSRASPTTTAQRSSSTARRARRRCRRPTTCMSATSRCRFRRSPTRRPTTRPVPRRPAGHDDLAPVRLQRHARPAEEGDGRRQGTRRRPSSTTCATA